MALDSGKTRRFEVDAGGHRIAAMEQGTGEPVLLLHGWGATMRFWHSIFPSGGKDYRIVAFDWPGFGGSDHRDAPFTVEWYAGLLDDILNVMQFEKVRLVGHCMGGAVGVRYSLDHPGRVRQLVLSNSFIQGKSALFMNQRFAMLPGIRRLIWWGLKVPWIRRVASKPFSYAARLEEDVLEDAARSSYAAMTRTVHSLKNFDVAKELKELENVFWVMGTDHDTILRPSQFELQREACRPGRVSVMKETGHIPMLERPEAYAEELKRVLGELS